jgi:hypothetical protein
MHCHQAVALTPQVPQVQAQKAIRPSTPIIQDDQEISKEQVQIHYEEMQGRLPRSLHIKQ